MYLTELDAFLVLLSTDLEIQDSHYNATRCKININVLAALNKFMDYLKWRFVQTAYRKCVIESINIADWEKNFGHLIYVNSALIMEKMIAHHLFSKNIVKIELLSSNKLRTMKYLDCIILNRMSCADTLTQVLLDSLRSTLLRTLGRQMSIALSMHF